MRWRHLKNSSIAVLASLVVSSGMASAALAITTVQSQVCEDFAAPAIVSPNDGTQTKEDTVMIEGTGEPGKTVAIMKGNVTVGAGTIASDGSFGFTVPLTRGNNTFVARETNECGTAKESSSITINADLPLPPVTEPTDTGGETVNGNDQPAAVTPDKPGIDSLGKPFPAKPNTSGFEKPKITSLRDGTTVYLDTLLIEGEAYPGSLVTVYVNGVSQAQMTSSGKGNFRIRIVLQEGVNTIKIRSTLGKNTAVSDEIKVTYVRRVTAALPRPLSDGEITTTVLASIAAVAGGAIVAIVLHRYGFGARRRE